MTTSKRRDFIRFVSSGQHVEIIALGEETTPSRKVSTPGILAGQIALKNDFDAPLPDDMRRVFEGDRLVA